MNNKYSSENGRKKAKAGLISSPVFSFQAQKSPKDPHDLDASKDLLHHF